MPKKIAVSNLNASTLDILNTIRANASAEYQSQIPVVKDAKIIPKVGDILYGYPTLANEFVSSLVNRIALVRVRSATFNNMYADLKKGMLEFGETVEEVFVALSKVREFNVEKAAGRELKRTPADVRTAFHAMNWKVQYPISISVDNLRTAFTSLDGVQDLIAQIVDSVYTAAEYDEFLLFKYLIIKAVANGKMKAVGFDSASIENAAVTFRAVSNKMQFLKPDYNAEGVHNSTPKDRQYIFMDSDFNAEYDVKVLAAAFNMDEAKFTGNLRLIDDFTTFDNERFAEIRANCDMIEEVTAEELAVMANVKAVLVDSEWFQIYDNLNSMSEANIASGLYWNYFYNVWKTVSSSPFSNAVCFVANSAIKEAPTTLEFTLVNKAVGENSVVLTFEPKNLTTLGGTNYQFVQTVDATKAGVAVHKYGAVIFPNKTGTYTPVVTVNGLTYTATAPVTEATNVGDKITLNKG